MKWRTKKWLYQYNSGLGNIGPIILISFFLFGLIGVVGSLFLYLIEMIEGEAPISVGTYAMGLFILAVTLLLIGGLLPFTLERIAKHHSCKNTDA